MKRILLILSLVAVIAFSTESCKNSTKNDTAKNNTNTIVKKNKDQQVSNNSKKENTNKQTASPKTGVVNQITTSQFKDLIFDFQNNQQWKYQGTLPCIVDFYADWCGPCKKVAPIMEDLAKEYKGKIIFYKVNVDNEKPVAQAFGIQSIPSILFIPKKGQPQMSVGLMPKSGYVNAIKQVLLIK